MKNRILALLLACAMGLTLSACGSDSQEDGAASDSAGDSSASSTDEEKTIKVGLVCIGDENDQGYTYNFIRGKEAATETLAAEGITVEWVVKYNIGEDDTCVNANIELAEEGCQVIINNSYGFEPYMLRVAADYPDVAFISCTNEASWKDDLDNTYNAFASIYEGRYVAGVVAGMKLQELIDSGEITEDEAVIGYVGAYSFAEVISGFTAYYLGARSVCPSVTMEVQFVGSWGDATLEASAASALIDDGCIMISQHSDNTTPATEAQKAGVYHTGYNNDMTGVAPDASLISTRIDWEIYFVYALETLANGGELEQDWCAGMADGAVVMTDLNESVAAEGTAEKMEEVIAQICSGELEIFDTSVFTVDGETLASALAIDTDGDYVADSEEAVFDGAFHESYFQSAPYFTIQIDGIEWLNSAY
ncbi:MAG: BMP family ABC transporter substrate-binding protein [Oscillospiraceae bacterium]|nr:BMP family ABC transporter substrate-binding protein [Oscillospiraceae bacterium]